MASGLGVFAGGNAGRFETAAGRAALPAVLLVAMLIRSFPLMAHASPTGSDYGHLMHHAQLYLDGGGVPEVAPFFQMGETRWAVLPGASVIFAFLAAVAARDPIACAPFVLLLAAVEVKGIHMLARRVLGREDSALVAALIAALLPSGASMTAWSAYGNLAALALIPYALLAWLEYWDRPTARSLAVASLVISGTASLHHLSSAVLGLTLILFSVATALVAPALAIRRLLPLAAAGAVLGLPTLLAMRELGQSLAGDIASAARFDVWRIDWALWARSASPLCLVFLAGGVLKMARDHRLRPSDRGLLVCYLAVILALAFGWVAGLHLYYMRLIFFLPPVAAIGAAAFVFSWSGAAARAGIALTIALGLGTTTLFESQSQAAYFDIMTPGTREGVMWTRAHSEPSDVIVVGSLLAFHAPPLLERPTMAAMPPDLVGNPAELPVAADAFAVLAGLPNMNAVLDARAIRFLIVTTRYGDAPDSYRSRAVLAAHPRMRLRFENADIVVYEVVPGPRA